MTKCYSPEGQRLRDYSESAIARLLSLRRVVITYSTKGRVLHATFLPHDGATVTKQARMGQKFSVREPLNNGLFAWRHTAMLKPRTVETLAGRPLTQAQFERELRDLCQRVCHDCLVSA
jgi:hypothetical protein